MLVLLCAGSAQGQTVTFSRLHDAVPSKFFDAATTRPDPLNPNRLLIGLESGIDPVTLTANDFRASTLPFGNREAMDTISFTITAPPGYYVSQVIYAQGGTGSTLRGAVEAGGATWVVAGFPARLGVFTSNPTLTGTADLTALRLRSVPVAITLSLFAAGSGNVAVTNARVRARLLPLTP